MGYLVNHPTGLSGVQGIGYDYVLGAGGVYVQSQSPDLAARVLVAPCEVRGLAPVAEKVVLGHGPIPAEVLELGLRWFRIAPDTERFFAVRWDGQVYRLVVPPQAGTATSLTYRPPRRRGRRVPLPRRLPRLLLGHRRPGRAGLPHLRRRRTPRYPPAGVEPPGGRLRPFHPSALVPGDRRPNRGVQLMGEEPEETQDGNRTTTRR